MEHLEIKKETDIRRPLVSPVAVLREEFDDWAVLFNPDSAAAVGINPVGVAIWKLMNGQRSQAEITAEIHQRFSGVPAAAEDQILVFIDDLAERGFIGFELEPAAR